MVALLPGAWERLQYRLFMEAQARGEVVVELTEAERQKQLKSARNRRYWKAKQARKKNPEQRGDAAIVKEDPP